MSQKDHLEPEDLRDLDLYAPTSDESDITEESNKAYAKRSKREWMEMMENIRKESGDWSPSDAG